MSIQHVAAILDSRDERLQGTRKLVLIALANRTDQNGICWPTQDLIAAECGIKVRSLQDHLKALEKDGFIARDTQALGQGRGARTTYTLHLEKRENAHANNAGANNAHANSDVCTRSRPRPTNLQEPTNAVCSARGPDFLNRCLSALGLDMNAVSGSAGLLNIAPLMALIQPALGEAADFELDVLPAITAARGKPIRSWSYFREPIIENRDRRLKGTPDPVERTAASAYRAPANGKPAAGSGIAAGMRLVAKIRESEQHDRDIRGADADAGNGLGEVWTGDSVTDGPRVGGGFIGMANPADGGDRAAGNGRSGDGCDSGVLRQEAAKVAG